MRYDRVYNFSAGPAMMPESVLEEIAAEVLNYHGSGMSVMEMASVRPTTWLRAMCCQRIPYNRTIRGTGIHRC